MTCLIVFFYNCSINSMKSLFLFPAFSSFIHYSSVCQNEGQIQNHQYFEQLKVLNNKEIPGPHLHLLSYSLWKYILKSLLKKKKCENQESKRTLQLLFSKQTLNKISYMQSLLLSLKHKQMESFPVCFYCLQVGAQSVQVLQKHSFSPAMRKHTEEGCVECYSCAMTTTLLEVW